MRTSLLTDVLSRVKVNLLAGIRFSIGFLWCHNIVYRPFCINFACAKLGCLLWHFSHFYVYVTELILTSSPLTLSHPLCLSLPLSHALTLSSPSLSFFLSVIQSLAAWTNTWPERPAGQTIDSKCPWLNQITSARFVPSDKRKKKKI